MYIMHKSTKEVAQDIRTALKTQLPQCKFSVRMKSFSGGSSITVALVEAPFEAFSRPEELRNWTSGYAQLNQYTLDDNNDTLISNAAHLTKDCFDVMVQARAIILNSNYEDDYSFLHIDIGKWDKPFTVRESI